MIRFAAVFALSMLGALPAFAFDAASQAAIDGLKAGKPVPIAAVTDLMLGSELWCYNQREGECGWSDLYLSVHGNQVNFELSHPWSESIDISYVSQGVLRDGRFICYSGYDWIPSVRGFERPDGWAIGGRELEALRLEIEQWTDLAGDKDCFDYVFVSADETAETVTLTQRQWTEGETDAANDAVVTLYFAKAAADELGWYW